MDILFGHILEALPRCERPEVWILHVLNWEAGTWRCGWWSNSPFIQPLVQGPLATECALSLSTLFWWPQWGGCYPCGWLKMLSSFHHRESLPGQRHSGKEGPLFSDISMHRWETNTAHRWICTEVHTQCTGLSRILSRLETYGSSGIPAQNRTIPYSACVFPPPLLNKSVVSVLVKSRQNAIVLSDVSTLPLSLSLGFSPLFFMQLCASACVFVCMGNSSHCTCIPPSQADIR